MLVIMKYTHLRVSIPLVSRSRDGLNSFQNVDTLSLRGDKLEFMVSTLRTTIEVAHRRRFISNASDGLHRLKNCALRYDRLIRLPSWLGNMI